MIAGSPSSTCPHAQHLEATQPHPRISDGRTKHEGTLTFPSSHLRRHRQSQRCALRSQKTTKSYRKISTTLAASLTPLRHRTSTGRPPSSPSWSSVSVRLFDTYLLHGSYQSTTLVGIVGIIAVAKWYGTPRPIPTGNGSRSVRSRTRHTFLTAQSESM
jgi:hypothetical protein